MVARLRYVCEVLKQAVPFAGWAAGLITLSIGGSIIGGAAWLAETHHRTLAVALLALGVLLAFIEGSYRVWVGVSTNLASAKAQATELDSVEARRAYLDEEIERALGLRSEFSALGERPDESWQDSKGVEDLVGDLDHWEDEVRAELKEAFSLEIARFFSSDAGVEPRSPDGDGSLYLGRANCLAYVDRRIARLREIRTTL